MMLYRLNKEFTGADLIVFNFVFLLITFLLVFLLIIKRLLNLKWSLYLLSIYKEILNEFLMDDESILRKRYIRESIKQIFIYNHSNFWYYYKYKLMKINLFATAQYFQFLQLNWKTFLRYFFYNFVNTLFFIGEYYLHIYTTEEWYPFRIYIFFEIFLVGFWITIGVFIFFILKRNVDIILFHKIIGSHHVSTSVIFREFLAFLYLQNIFNIDEHFLREEAKELERLNIFHDLLLSFNYSYYSDYSDYIYYQVNNIFDDKF